jgi:hypothetical protein
LVGWNDAILQSPELSDRLSNSTDKDKKESLEDSRSSNSDREIQQRKLIIQSSGMVTNLLETSFNLNGLEFTEHVITILQIFGVNAPLVCKILL